MSNRNPNLATRWQPGQSGNPGGRPRKLLPRVDETLHEQGLDPVKEILALLPELKPKDRVDTWLHLLSYVQPKPKVDGLEEDDVSQMPLKDLVALVKTQLPDLEKEAG